MRVVAIVVTHNRPDPLRATVSALAEQHPSIDGIVVVDGGTTDPVEALDVDGVPVAVVDAGGNVGYGAGLAIGMRYARDHFDPDYYWLSDDDSPVGTDSLQRMSEVLLGRSDVGIIGNRGGSYRRGIIRHNAPSPSAGEQVQACDFCLVDGAFLSRAAVEAVGYPREDLFMVHEDLEYTTRIAAAGLDVLVSPAVSSEPMYLGSAPEATATHWRKYYQSRNHLRMVLDRRSPWGVAGWFYREGAIVLSAVARRKQPWQQIRMVSRGALDALRGRMGRTVEPS